MAEYLVQGESITAVADAIREKGGTTAPLSFPAGMATAVRDIPSGGTDISLGLTAATVGQTVVVKAVDEAGKPTEWEVADKLPKSPANWEPWTSDEQAVALKRLGVSKSILDFTYDGEDVDTLSVQIQDIQDFFRARVLIFKCSIFLDAPSTSWVTVRVISYQNGAVVSNSFQISYNSVPSADANTEIMARSVHFRTDEIINYLTIGKRWGKAIGLNSPGLDVWSSYNKLGNTDVTNKLAVLFPSIDGGAKYKAGTSISIVGVM